MDVSLTVSGLLLSLAGLATIGIYTVVNRHSRTRGAKAHWLRGWFLAVPGMTSIGVGWGLLCIAEPRFHDSLPISIAGAVLSLAAGGLYFASAARVGRLQPLSKYSLGLYTGGIYRWVRHPQALALCTLSIGLAITSGSMPFTFLLPVWIASWVGYTYLEEHFELIPTFGDEYLRYRKETSRIIPWPRRRRRGEGEEGAAEHREGTDAHSGDGVPLRAGDGPSDGRFAGDGVRATPGTARKRFPFFPRRRTQRRRERRL